MKCKAPESRYDSAVQTPLQIVRKSSFESAPWKNGRGITHEALRVPDAGEPFRWRVSVAHIDSSGPFSNFSGYVRRMVLLRGTGVTLKFNAGESRELRSVGELVEFDGADQTYCELLDGPCVDLNLMVASAIAVQARVTRLDAGIAVAASPNQSTIIFGIDDPLLLESDAGETHTLEPWDLAVVRGSGARLNRVASGNIPTVGSVFIATLDE
jgi:environmental stress-induced protein Ves